MKKNILLFIFTLLSTLTSSAADAYIDGVYYNLDIDTKQASVTSGSYGRYTGSVIIRNYVKDNNDVTYRVTSIGDYAFSNCSGLISVTIPNSVTIIENNAFYNCSGLTSVTIPNSVTSIGEDAFSGCSSLTSITIPNSVTTIEKYTFEGCSSLTSIEIPYSVTSIGRSAFEYCSSLTSVTIPESVTSIGMYAFSGCSSLTKVELNSNAIASRANLNGIFGNQVKEYILGNSVTEIGNGAFQGCDDLTSVTIPSSVTSIGGFAFYHCPSLTSIEIPNSVTSIGQSAFMYCSGLTSVTIPNSVTEIGDFIFQYCSSLTSVTIGNSVTEIGEYAFQFCSELTSVTIGNSVTEIGANTFKGCSGLTKVELNSNAIVSKAYTYSSSLKDIFGSQVKEYILGNSITSIGDNAFSNCSGLTSLTIGSGVTSIGSGVCMGCSNLTSIHITDIAAWCKIKFTSNPLSLAGHLFIDGKEITDLVIPNSVKSIGEGAFIGCIGLRSVTIGNSVTEIEDFAFAACSGLRSVTIGNSVKSIGEGAFYGCSGLTSIEIPNSVTSIGDGAFYQCSGLRSVTIGNNVTTIGDYAFSNCSLLNDVICYVIYVPITYSNTFSDTPINKATLHVPKASKEAYKTTEPWSGFGSIVGIGDEPALRGDANGDGEIGMPDVMFIVNYILGTPAETFNAEAADANLDGEIGMPDVMFIVQYILNGKFPDDEEEEAGLTCPDDNHPHMIDLGLPSGTKWACCNVGASKPEDYGDYFACGEVEPKSKYDIDNYIGFGIDDLIDGKLPDTYGTEKDVAHVKWGGNWRIPTLTEVCELRDNCTFKEITLNGIKGMKVTGKNGNSIFLPAAGRREGGESVDVGKTGHYWQGCANNDGTQEILAPYYDLNQIYWGLTIRPVYVE